MTVAAKLVGVYFPAQCVAMNPQDFCGARLISVQALQNALDELLLEFRHSLIEQDAAVNHHSDQGFQLFFHDCTLRRDSVSELLSALRGLDSNRVPCR